jgi:DNA-directed RNA polymerase specialized sigma24 family protein
MEVTEYREFESAFHCQQKYVAKKQEMLPLCNNVTKLQHDFTEKEIERLMPLWRAYAIGLMKDVVRGEDLLSETLLKCFENAKDKIDELAKEKTLKWYVNRSLYLMAIDKSSRYAIKYRRYEEKWNEKSYAHHEERQEAWLGSRIDNEYLDAYISMMNKLDSTIIRLYMMQDFDYAIVSKETGIPIRDLYKLVENAINKIKRNAKFQRPSTDS